MALNPIFRRIVGFLYWRIRPDTYNRHVSEQHVEKLRQLIHVGRAQIAPDFCDAGVIDSRGAELRPLFPKIGSSLSGCIAEKAVRVHRHGAEFQNFEMRAILPDAPLFNCTLNLFQIALKFVLLPIKTFPFFSFLI